MGLFSAKCKCCGLSILSWNTGGLAPQQKWLTKTVAITPLSKERNQIIRGDYDGYGRIVSAKGSITEGLWDGKWQVDLYHEECWKLAGEPMAFTGGSKDAEDQGFFIDAAKYAKAKPKGLPISKTRSQRSKKAAFARTISIKYHWSCKSITGEMPEQLAECLEESAMDRIGHMISEGFTSGELHDTVNIDIPGHTTPEDGFECHGWFEVKTK